jgi:HEAT repeat protein
MVKRSTVRRIAGCTAAIVAAIVLCIFFDPAWPVVVPHPKRSETPLHWIAILDGEIDPEMSYDAKVDRDRETAAKALGEIGPLASPAVPTLIRALRIRRGLFFSQFIRDEGSEAARQALIQIGPKARPALRKAMKHDDPVTRIQACRVLWAVTKQADEVLPVLINAIKEMETSPDAHIAGYFAREGLLEIAVEHPDIVRTHLLELFQYEEEDIVYEAGRGLQEMGPAAEPAAPQMIAALSGENTTRSHLAGEVLLRIGSKGEILLINALKHPDAKVRANATVALSWQFKEDKQKVPSKELVTAVAEGLDDMDEVVIVEAIRGLSIIGHGAESSVPAISKRLEYHAEKVRSEAAYGLGDFGPAARSAMPALEKATADDKSQVRVAAFISLAKIAGKEAVPTLAKGLGDDDEQVRLAVVNCLAKMQDDPAAVVPLLIMAAQDSRHGPSLSAIQALKSFGPAADAAVPVLIVLLHHADGWTRNEAAYALGALGPGAHKAIPALINGIKNPLRPLNWYAVWSLGELHAEPDTVIPALIDALSHKDSAVRMWSAWALGRFGPQAKEAMPRLRQLLQDRDAERYVKEAMRRIEEK